MEIPRHWRLKKQRYGLVGEMCLKCEEKIFPPKSKHECKKIIVFDSGLLFSPNHKVVHSEVVRQDQE